MHRQQAPEITPEQIKRILQGGTLWAVIALLLIVLVSVTTLRYREVGPDEIGLLLNRISGNVETQPKGMCIYNGILGELFILDGTLQTLNMTQDASRGDRSGRDDLKVKTVDGSDVYVDIKVMYRIIPDLAAEALRTSGPGSAFKEKWARDYTRAICREYLGELTTEGFYDPAQRDAKIALAQADINQRLQPFAIEVDNIVIPRRPQFYKEYEAIIQRKKYADQAVQEEQSKALAAKQKQTTQVVVESNKMNVALEEYSGQMRQLVIAAEADAERISRDADGYYAKHTVAAEATLYKMQQNAAAILATKKAEADGLLALKEALQGQGGVNMVKLEYARRLKGLVISGQPITREGHAKRMEHRVEGNVMPKGGAR